MGSRIDSAFQEMIGNPSYPFQKTIINALMRKRSVFGVVPTGSGKSMCFQVPANLRKGLVLVVSPLISLMKDQVDSCTAMGLRCARITHDVPKETVRDIYRGLRDLQLLYIAPERLKSAKFLRRLQRARLSLLALDEVHEHSKSGRDFRPAYALVGDLIQRYEDVPVVALTATADEDVEREFIRALHGREYKRVIASPHRENLKYKITREVSPRAIVDIILPIQKAGDAVIVYCSTRAICDNVNFILSRFGVHSGTYHGGMRAHERHENQAAWMAGELSTMVATNAFGLGVNKLNVRMIFHYMHPGSVFSYLQEAGRAGRDGLDADCYMNLSADGLRTQQYFIEVQNPAMRVYTQIWNYLNANGGNKVVTFYNLARQFNLHRSMTDQVASAIRFMEYHGCLQTTPRNTHYTLPLLNMEAARPFAAMYSYVHIQNRLVDVNVPPSQPDPVNDMVDERAVAFQFPKRFVQLRRLTRSLCITADNVTEKRQHAEDRLQQVYQFAAAEDRQTFVESVFLQRQKEEL